MQWIVITAADLNDYVVGAQAAALRTAALASGQSDRFANVMAAVASRIRAEVQACRTNRISSTANSIPPDLKQQACILIIESLQTGIPSLQLTEDQRRLADDARAYLRRVSEGKVPISLPDDPMATETVQAAGYIQVASNSTKQCTRETLKGL